MRNAAGINRPNDTKGSKTEHTEHEMRDHQNKTGTAQTKTHRLDTGTGKEEENMETEGDKTQRYDWSSGSKGHGGEEGSERARDKE